MDQFTAHLDRGWDLAQRGDARGAELSARRALELEAQSPEAHNLLGFACALRGEFDEALEYYRQALALDDTFLDAILNAAELCLHPLGQYEEVLQLCEDALDLAETSEEIIDVLLLQFDAYLGLSRREEAKRILENLPEGPLENPMQAFLLGRAFFEIDNWSRAEELLLDAVRRDADNPDAPYYLALIREEQNDAAGALEAFLTSRALELQAPGPLWSLSREAFQECVHQAIKNMTPRLRPYLDLEEVFLGDMPGIEVIVEGADPRAPVLVDILEGPGPAVRVFVYQRNLERMAGSLEHLEDEIRHTLEREVASALLGHELTPPAEGSQLN